MHVRQVQHAQQAPPLSCMRHPLVLSAAVCSYPARLPSSATGCCPCACAGQEREPWEGRSALVYWLELAADLTLHALMLGHYLHLW